MASGAVKRVFEELEKREEELVHLTRELVRIPSPVGQEGAAQAFMKEKMGETGLEVRTFEANRLEMERHEAYIDIPGTYEGRPNVIGTLPGSPDHRSLILNGHVDVVSAEPLDQWSFDPWGGRGE